MLQHTVRLLLWVIGAISLALGVIGIFLPVMPTAPFVLLEDTPKHIYVAQTGLFGGDFPTHNTPMRVVPGARELGESDNEVQLRFESPEVGGVKLIKTWTLKRGSYDVGVRHEVVNTGTQPVTPQLYLQLVRDGGKVETEIEPELNLGFQALIPEEYVSDPKERLHYYKALSSCRDEGEIAEIVDDMRDRFGSLPDALKTFVAVLMIKIDARRLGAVRMDLFEDRALVHWDETRHNLDPVRLMAWVGENAAAARILPPAKLELRMPGHVTVTAAMQTLKDMLLGLRDRVRAGAAEAGQD